MVFDHTEALHNTRKSECGNNTLMLQEIQKRMFKQCERLLESFGRTSLKTKETFTYELIQGNYSPREVEEAVDELISLTGLPCVGDVKKHLNMKFKRDPSKNFEDEKNKEQAKLDRDSYLKLRDDIASKKNWKDEDFNKYTRYYVREVFGESVLTCEFIKCFEQIALKDLALSGMNLEGAIERGRESVNKSNMHHK